MSIPANSQIEWELLCLLHKAPIRGMEVQLVYQALEKKFPCLTVDDLTVPYKSSTGSKWKTAVRSVREKCKKENLISKQTDRGFWALTDKGHKALELPQIPGLD